MDAARGATGRSSWRWCCSGARDRVVGFPEGTPLRHGRHLHLQPRRSAAQFLRTTYKAAPLVALGARGPRRRWRVAALRAAPRGCVAAGGLARCSSRLAAGRSCAAWRARTASWPADSVPAAWTRRGARPRPHAAAGTARIVLPGQLFAFYRWGGTVDPILPALTDKPVAEPLHRARSPTCARSTCCGRPTRCVSQQRALPGQLRPLLELMGVGAVVQGTDDDRSRSGVPAAGRRRAVLPSQRPRRAGRAATGRRARHAGAAGTLEPAAPAGRGAPLRRVRRPRGHRCACCPRAAADRRRRLGAGARRPRRASARCRRPRRCATPPTSTAAQLRAAAAAGGAFVVSDSNRRRVFVAARLRGNAGLDAAAPTSRSRRTPRCSNPFAARGHRRPDRRGARRRAERARAASRPASRSSPSTGRSRRSTATRRRPGSPTARSRCRATTST